MQLLKKISYSSVNRHLSQLFLLKHTRKSKNFPLPIPTPVVCQRRIEPAGRDGLEAGPAAVLLCPERQWRGEQPGGSLLPHAGRSPW